MIEDTGLTVNAWSVTNGLVQSTVSRITKGLQDPSTEIVRALADKLGVQAWQLLAPGVEEAANERSQSFSCCLFACLPSPYY